MVCWSTQFKHVLLELAPAVPIVREHVEAGAGGGQEDRVARHRQRRRPPHRLGEATDLRHRANPGQDLTQAGACLAEQDDLFGLVPDHVGQSRVFTALLAASGDQDDGRRQALQRLDGGVPFVPLESLMYATPCRTRTSSITCSSPRNARRPSPMVALGQPTRMATAATAIAFSTLWAPLTGSPLTRQISSPPPRTVEMMLSPSTNTPRSMARVRLNSTRLPAKPSAA